MCDKKIGFLSRCRFLVTLPAVRHQAVTGLCHHLTGIPHVGYAVAVLHELRLDEPSCGVHLPEAVLNFDLALKITPTMNLKQPQTSTGSSR